jgi:hypothetical protein
MSAAAIAGKSPDGAFLCGSECRKRYGLSQAAIYRLAALAEVRVKLLPGRPPLYSAIDLDRAMAARQEGA